MLRPTTLFVFVTASTLVLPVHSLRNSSDHDVRISVLPRSFQSIGALTQLQDEHSAKPEKDRAAALFSLDRGSESSTRQGEGEAAALFSLDRVSDSSALQSTAVEKPTVSGSASESESEKAKERATAQLEEVALERQQVMQNAERLDREMNEQYAALGGDEAGGNHGAGSLVSVAETESAPGTTKELTEDEQFDALEKQTDSIMKWFQQIKSLRKERDQLKAKKDAAVKGASSAGINQEDIAKKILAPAPDVATSKSKSDGKTQGSGLLEKRQKLSGLMASSALEMAKLQSAASDVMTGLDAYAVWQKRNDDGAESQAEAARVKAQLDSAVKFLAEHEDSIDYHTEQIDAMMRETGNAAESSRISKL